MKYNVSPNMVLKWRPMNVQAAEMILNGSVDYCRSIVNSAAHEWTEVLTMADLIYRDALGVSLFPLGKKDAADIYKIIMEQPAVNRWIPCSERLPDMPVEGLDAKYSDCCLVCDAHDWIGMAYCLTDGKKT
jgi:hypothetical protein